MKQVESTQPDFKEPGVKPYAEADLRQIHIAGGISIAAGIWLAVAPIVFHYAQPIIRWNDTIAGLFLIVLATLRYIHPLHRFWMSSVTAFIGLWLTASPFLSFSGATISPHKSMIPP
jgi:hypothetical protein